MLDHAARSRSFGRRLCPDLASCPVPDIILIEDDREIASTLTSVLEAAGYTIEHAFNGMEGRKLIEQSVPRLVITDMMMPKMGGFPVLEYCKSLDSPPKVIMITANEGGRHKAYAEMLGAVDYLRKPFAMDVLLETVAGTIGDPDGSEPAAESPADNAPLKGRLRRGKSGD